MQNGNIGCLYPKGILFVIVFRFLTELHICYDLKCVEKVIDLDYFPLK